MHILIYELEDMSLYKCLREWSLIYYVPKNTPEIFLKDKFFLRRQLKKQSKIQTFCCHIPLDYAYPILQTTGLDKYML